MKLKKLAFSSLFAVLIVLGSYISIPLPFTPVPLTLQLFFILLAGSLLGSYYGFLSVLLYEILGILGFPVFAGGQAGLSVLLGPTGGYLFGFLIAPVIIGLLYRKNKKLLIPGLILAILEIHLFGITYLSFNLRISLSRAFLIGSLPFLLLDFVKGILVYLFSSASIKLFHFSSLS